MKAVTASLLSRLPLPALDADGDKDARGRILVVGGSAGVPGAVLLAGVAALRAGAGKLQLATIADVAIPLGLAVPEALVVQLGRTLAVRPLLPFIGGADAILVGPGMEQSAAVRKLAREIIRRSERGIVLLDAAALPAVDAIGDRGVITPHSGEMASLLRIPREEVDANAPDVARLAADRFGCVVALKGPTTWIAAGTELYRYDGGTVGLATSGSGDMLAGVIAGLAARTGDPLRATLWGVFAHGSAGNRLSRRMGPVGFLARELLAEIPPILARRR